MFFEGSEKKVEISFKDINLLELGDAFWAEVVKCSQAQILSSIRNQKCTAYLLSESSLFVWKNRITMLTCGETTLVKAIIYCLEHIGKDKLDFLTFERKNEYHPEKQRTSFEQDIAALDQYLEGKAFKFGQDSNHFLYLYHLDKPHTPPQGDVTLEVLMYGLGDQAKEAFGGKCKCVKQARQLTEVDKIFEGFEVDDYLFDPCGYSLNALRKDEYYTIHVTPQEVGAYVSFETNVKINNNYLPVLQRVIDVFQPESFDVIVFRTQSQEFLKLPGYQMFSAEKQTLSCGYYVNYCSFSSNPDVVEVTESRLAKPLNMESNNG